MIDAARAEGEMKGIRAKALNLEAERKAGPEGLHDNCKPDAGFPSVFPYGFVLVVAVGRTAATVNETEESVAAERTSVILSKII